MYRKNIKKQTKKPPRKIIAIATLLFSSRLLFLYDFTKNHDHPIVSFISSLFHITLYDEHFPFICIL